LNSLSYRQINCTMPASSLESALESVALKRLMFSENPKMAAESLSRALDTLSDIQEAFGGMDQEALASVTDALKVQRKLYQEYPMRYRGFLAVLLFHAALRYDTLDRRPDSEAARVECEELCRGCNETRRQVLRNIKADMARHLKLDRTHNAELMRSLSEALEAQVGSP
jgi:hypothetical protein